MWSSSWHLAGFGVQKSLSMLLKISNNVDHCFLFWEMPFLVGSRIVSFSKKMTNLYVVIGRFCSCIQIFPKGTLQSTLSLHRQLLTTSWDNLSAWFFKSYIFSRAWIFLRPLALKSTPIYSLQFAPTPSHLLNLFGIVSCLLGFTLPDWT